MKARKCIHLLLFILLSALLFTSCEGDTAPSDDIPVTDTAPINTDTALVTDAVTEPPETEAVETEPDESLREPLSNEKAESMIKFQYEKAVRITDIVLECGFETSKNDSFTDEDGYTYIPVTDHEERAELDGASIATFDDLSKYIKSIFARSIADRLISRARESYDDFEGVLCLVVPPAADEETDVNIPEADDTESPEEDLPEEPKIVSIEFFLSKFTDKMFRYTAAVTYSAESSASFGEDSELTQNPSSPLSSENSESSEPSEKSERKVEYYDFIFENTGNGWYWTEFPALPEIGS